MFLLRTACFIQPPLSARRPSPRSLTRSAGALAFALSALLSGCGKDAGVALLKRHLNKEEEARALVRELFISSGDIEPDEVAKTLSVRIHRMVTPAHDKAIAALLDDLNALEFCHPETAAKMIYSLV